MLICDLCAVAIAAQPLNCRTNTKMFPLPLYNIYYYVRLFSSKGLICTLNITRRSMTLRCMDL